ncbi:MAG TPA: type IV secretion system DNA-binding domain-containing protein [Burkholderiales bacterium]|nr:type IV secretion system DNA-binding domain-containing protein [Burkholderiales bacterium]
MRRDVVNLFLQPVPANLPPSTYVRRVDHAIFGASAVFALVYFGIGFGFCYFTRAPLVPFLHSSVHWPLPLALYPALVLALLAAAAVFIAGLTPWRNLVHIEGPRLLEGKDAARAATRIAKRECAPQEPFLSLHPLLPLPKSRWTRGVFFYGSPRSGKTVALIPIIEQLIEKNHCAIIYDVKGDFTSYWLGNSVGLVCPWDRRSMVWDIGRDLRSPSQAQVFASSLIKENERDPFWSGASRQLLEGTIKSLQNECGAQWGWSEVAQRLNEDATSLAERMAEHHPKASNLVANAQSQTTASVMANLAAHTKIIDDLALAWGDGRDESGNEREHIAFTDWLRDGYKGKRRQIILQAGDKNMTSAFVSAVVNVIAPEILSPRMKDDEFGRTIAFVIDELPSVKFDFQALIERGASKGVVFLGTCQTLEQIKEVWGESTMKSLGSMVGTHLVFQVQQSQTREELSAMFGKARYAITNVSTSSGEKGNQNISVHEEARAVVQPYELTELLGKRATKKSWSVRALVSLGGDVLCLDFPGVSPQARRSSHRAAHWTRGPAKPKKNALERIKNGGLEC